MESKLINGDSLEVLKDYDENSIDLLCTDPPYGYGFMGKHWDTFQEKKSTKSQKVGWMSPGMTKSTYGMKEFFVPIWEEALRVLKPGAFSFVMSAPRSDVQTVMVQTLQKAGFDVSFSPIYWAYATGFPKAMNMGKSVTKRGDIDKAKKLDGSYAGYQPKPAVEVVIVAMKPLDQKGYLDQALDNGKGVTWLDDCRIPFAGMSDKENYTDERGWDKWGLSEDYEKYKKDNVGSQKNFDTEAEGLSRGNQPARKTTKRKPRTESNVFKTSGFKSEDNDTADASPFGRFAANLLVSDDVLNDGGSFSRYFSLDAWWENRVSKLPKEIQWTFPFLIIPKASKAEKNMGLEKGKFSKTIGHNRFDQCATCGGYILQNQDRPSACKCENPVRKDNTIKGNFHPTVKPFQLFSYLVTLGSRKDDVVLDPFAGSGTTGISCVFEDRKFICIEREKEYFDIMESRIEKAKNPEGLVDHEFWE